MKSSVPSKIKFDFCGVAFSLPSKFFKATDYSGKPDPHIDVNRVAAASMIKQYVKAKYPKVVVSVKSDIYSGGSSTRAYLSDNYGMPVDEKIFKDVKRFGDMFEYGRYNGMEDIYEFNNNSYSTEKGMRIEPGVKYVFVENRPQFDTVEEITHSIMETMAGGRFHGQENRPHSIEEAVSILRDFHDNESRISKAVERVKELVK